MSHRGRIVSLDCHRGKLPVFIFQLWRCYVDLQSWRMSLQLLSHVADPENTTKSIGAIAPLRWFRVLVPGWRRLHPFRALKGVIPADHCWLTVAVLIHGPKERVRILQCQVQHAAATSRTRCFLGLNQNCIKLKLQTAKSVFKA